MANKENERKKENRPKFFLKAGFLFVATFIFLPTTYYLLPTVAWAQNFIGPSGSAGVGQGAIAVDSSYNLAVGTTTPQSDTKLLIVGTSTTSGYYAIKAVNLNTGPLFIVRSDGSVTIGSNQIQTNQTTGALTTITGVGTPPSTGSLYVNGPIFNTLDVKTNGLAVGTTTAQSGGNAYFTGGITAVGTITAGTLSGSYSGTITAANISSGAFGSNTGGGNYTFPANVGIGATGPVAPLQIGQSVMESNLKYRGLIVQGGYSASAQRQQNLISFGTTGSFTSDPFTDTGSESGKNWHLGVVTDNAYYNTDRFSIINNGIERLSIDKNTGNVGIGTTGPGSVLDVQAANTTLNLKSTTGTNGARIQFQNTGGTGYIGLQSSIGGDIISTGAQGYYLGIAASQSDIYGGIQFATGLAASAKMTILPNGNVGIGTTGPAQKLEVSSGGGSWPQVKVDNTAAGSTAGVRLSGNNGGSIWDVASNYSGTNNEFSVLYNSATSVLTALPNGNVGIGTTTPHDKFEVYGGGAYVGDASSRTWIGPSGGTNYIESGNTLFTANAPLLLTGFNNALGSTFTANFATSIFNGNVGIGTTSPSSTLTVAGIIRTTSGGVIFPDNSTQTTAYLGGSQTIVAGNVSSGAFGSNTGGGNYSFPANIGIGVASAGQRLTVAPNSAMGFTLGGLPNPVMSVGAYGANPSDGIGFFVKDTTTGYQGWAGAIVTGGENCSGWGCKSLRIQVPDAIGNVLNALSILGTSGNVGIGTTSPTLGKLEVDGSNGELIDANVTTGYGAIGLSAGGVNKLLLGYAGSNSNYGGQTIAGDVSIKTANTNLHFVTGSGNANTTMYLSSTGNVGIGTTSPTQPLEVHTTTNQNLQVLNNGGTLQLQGINDAKNANVPLNIVGSSIALNSGTVPGVYVQATTGNVGIGTAAPSYKLSVVNTALQPQFLIGSDQAGNMLTFDSAIGAGLGNIMAGAYWNGANYIYGGTRGASRIYLDDGLLHFLTGGTTGVGGTAVTFRESMTILNNGNIGISNTNPAYTLDVAGTGNFTGVVNVGTPVAASNAATKSYVDSVVGGGSGSGSFATLSVSGNWTLSGAAQANLNLNGYSISGVNKLTVTTIDPVYDIGGIKYATYGADTIGLKTEVYGKAELNPTNNSKLITNNSDKLSVISYKSIIDFNKAERGSDPWLFWQTIDEGANMKDIIVNLTPEFDGRVWYELNPAKKQIVIYAKPTTNNQQPTTNNYFVSYHLVAPRHDASQWGNVLTNSSEKGTVLNVK